jgi:large subunit ribosomal protein L21
MYAIIRAGGKQAKVQSGDVIEIERVKGDAEELSFMPLLVVDDKGNAVSDRDLLAKASVTAKILGEAQGPKIDIFKYKNKTGNRRHQGHRQVYTRIEITGIELPGSKAKSAPAKTASKTEAKPADEVTDTEKSAAVEPVATKPAAAKPAAKSAAAKPAAKPAAKSAAAKPAAKPAAKSAAAKPAAAKPTKTAAKADSEEE